MPPLLPVWPQTRQSLPALLRARQNTLPPLRLQRR
jgi:hypothetical protein